MNPPLHRLNVYFIRVNQRTSAEKKRAIAFNFLFPKSNLIRNAPQKPDKWSDIPDGPLGGMPPKVYLTPHLTTEELRARYRQVQDPTEARRWHLILLVAEDWTIKRAAQAVGLNYDYAKDIIHRYNREGPSSVRNRSSDHQPPQSKSLLTPAQLEELRQVLQNPPPDGGPWSGPKVANWIAQKTGSEHVWPQRGWDYLKRLGVKWRQPPKKRSLPKSI